MFYKLQSEKKIVLFYLDILATTNISDFVNYFASTVLGKLESKPEKFIKKVGEIFTSIRPVVADDAIWAISLRDGKPVRDAKLVVRAGPNAAVDGLAMDIEGRLYIAANGAGQLWRYDPATEEMLLLASGMFGLASLAFGEGEFDHQSIYATATNAAGRGGKIWRIPVGTTGARLYR